MVHGGAERLAADDQRSADCQRENAQHRDDAAEDDAPPPAPLDLVEQGVLLAFRSSRAIGAAWGRCVQLVPWSGSLGKSLGDRNNGADEMTSARAAMARVAVGRALRPAPSRGWGRASDNGEYGP